MCLGISEEPHDKLMRVLTYVMAGFLTREIRPSVPAIMLRALSLTAAVVLAKDLEVEDKTFKGSVLYRRTSDRTFYHLYFPRITQSGRP